MRRALIRLGLGAASLLASAGGVTLAVLLWLLVFPQNR